MWITRPIICAIMGIEACWRHVKNRLLKSIMPKKYKAGIIGSMYLNAYLETPSS